ncbi:hypothetical protein I541_1054 [Mycobacteroides abscessus]|nr:hypothetical protein I541_1054 [Mycobacteroides abscessus]
MLEFLAENRHTIQVGPYVTLDENMASNHAIYTIYRLAMP